MRRFSSVLPALVLAICGSAPIARAQNFEPISLDDAINGYESAAHQSFLGVPTDWMSHQVAFPKPEPGSDAEYKVQQDPRYWMQQIRRAQPDSTSPSWYTVPSPIRSGSSNVKKDWAFSLGGGTVAQNMFAAKYSFNAGSTTLTSANCTSDFAVYGLNVAGATGGQANLVALENLYSGSSPTGLCGTAPTVKWAYNVTTETGGTVPTSPVLSGNGQEVIFIESYSGGSILHILRWDSADGGTVGSSVKPTNAESAFSSCPGGTSSCLVSITLGAGSTHTTTNSSPFYDYTHDIAYVGDDAGTLYRITPVLGSGTPVVKTLQVATASTGSPAVLTGPVYDSDSELVLVGAENGTLYAVVASTMALATHPSVQVGWLGTSCTHPNNALIDPPLVDSTNGFAFETATTGADKEHMVAVQVFTTGTNSPTGSSWTAASTSDIGYGDDGCNSASWFSAHSPTFDNTYYTTPASGHLWACGAGTSTSTDARDLYSIAFSGSPAVLATSGTLCTQGGNTCINDSGHPQCSALTEIYNGATTTDYLFLGEGLSGTGDFADLYGFTISTGGVGTAISGSPISYPSSATSGAPAGISAIIIDNLATQAQASSIYFTTETESTTVCGSTSAYCAVKLTQSALK